MSTTISQHCAALLDQSGNATTNDKLRTFFDAVTAELTKSTPPNTNFDDISQVVTTLLAVDKKQLCKQSQLIDHPLLAILRDHLARLLFNQEQRELASRLSVLLHNICFAGVSFDAILKLMFSQSLVDELCHFFREIEKHVNATILIEIINRLLEIFQNIQMVGFDQRNNPLFERLFNSLVDCFTSSFFKQVLSTVPNSMLDLSPPQSLLFDTAIEFMYWQPYEDSLPRKRSLARLCDSLLHCTVERMSALSSSEPVARLGSLLALNVAMMDDKTVGKDYYSLLDHCASMLDRQGGVQIQRALLSNCCFLSYDIDLVVHMKNNPRLKSLCLKLSESEDSEVSFHAYRILAMIMTEEDIKTLSNASKIVGVFSVYFISMIDDPIQRTAFHSLLHSLKSFAQHEQIKIELVEQGVIPLLVQCVTEQSFRTAQVRQCALEILLALSFNDKALNVIAQDANFMAYLQTLNKSTEEGIQRVANHLLWQFEQKGAYPPAHASDSTKSTFDIMLSYSHSDKKLCFQIYDNLIRNGFRVWLDRDRMHGDTMGAMAAAIENSAFVLICMSEAYKQSPYCRAEAHYAFQRQCHLIPLVMKAKYRPDGWLGIMVSGKIYVDFTKHEFHVAYSMLKTEIDQKRNLADSPVKTIDTAHELPVPKYSLSIKDKNELPHCVDVWSAEHVRSFLILNNFTSLLPVFADFNGRLLQEAYSMCQSSRETMFQSLKSEVTAAGNGPLLTLGTYLRFLEELKRYIPVNRGDKPQGSTSAVCTIT